MYVTIAVCTVALVLVIVFAARSSLAKKETAVVRQEFENYKREVEYRRRRPLNNNEKGLESPIREQIEVPVEKEVVKYVDRIVEKKIEVPIEKEIIKYVDRIVEKKVEVVHNPTEEEKKQIFKEAKEQSDKIIAEANKQAEEIVLEARMQAEESSGLLIDKAKARAELLTNVAESDANTIRRNAEEFVKSLDNRQAVLEKWSDELKEKERLTAYNHTRSENHRKAALDLKHEAQQIRNDALRLGSQYLDDLYMRVGNLLDVTRIDDELVFEGVSRKLNERRKAHRKRMKEDAKIFADANFHDLQYDSQKICLMAVFYCDLLIDKLIGKVKSRSMEQSLDMIRQAVSSVEALFPASVQFKISDAYIQAKKEELQLLYEIDAYKQEQKELRRRELEARREEAKAQKELEAERKRAEKDEMEAQAAIERNRFEMAQAKSQEEIEKFRSRIIRLEEALKQAQERRERALSMAQQTKCGYVYVISNIGSFGEGVYKIGMTRRVEPMDRVVELGDASVPFPFDVHAMIYTEDAPSLEAELHRVFDSRKLNSVNGRKEFFRVPLHEIREQVENFGIVCEWVEKPVAKQYRDSQYIK